MSDPQNYTTNPLFDTLASKGWRGARDIADLPGLLDEARHQMRLPQPMQAPSPDKPPSILRGFTRG